jgi:7,8-dihydroneopterin aldolase/epimerase/oxygenase
MGIINLEGLEFYAYHGHYKEEQIVGGKFIVSLEIETDVKKAAQSDNLKDALNYVEAYEIIKSEMKRPSHLLENIASRILDTLFNHFGKQIQRAKVSVSKINPPVGGKIGSVTVTIAR